MTTTLSKLSVGIIGSAGRKEDAQHLTYELYQNLGQKIFAIVKELDTDRLVSGGAAFVDHLAISIFLKSQIALKLHLPAEFGTNPLGYVHDGKLFHPGKVCNYYHQQFSAILGRDSLVDIAKTMYRGAEHEVTPGFKERNTKVAQDSDILIAATFGDKEKLKPGGTMDTWDKFSALKPHNKKIHIDLHTLEVYYM